MVDRAQRFRRPTATAGMDGRADAVRGEGGPAQATPVQVVRAATTSNAREDQRAWGGVPIGNERGGGLPLDGERGGNVAVHRGDGGVLSVHGLGERATCATDYTVATGESCWSTVWGNAPHAPLTSQRRHMRH